MIVFARRWQRSLKSAGSLSWNDTEILTRTENASTAQDPLSVIVIWHVNLFVCISESLHSVAAFADLNPGYKLSVS